MFELLKNIMKHVMQTVLKDEDLEMELDELKCNLYDILPGRRYLVVYAMGYLFQLINRVGNSV